MIVVDTATRRLTALDRVVDCAIGHGGPCAAADKREGDGRTPRGRLAIRTALFRPDRIAAPATALPWRWLRPTDGWSDDPADAAYNRPVTYPHGASAERLWRDDGVYDVIIVLGWNDAPVVRGMGSAIFLHCSRPDFAPTEGCVAIPRDALLEVVARLEPASVIEIV